MRTGLRHRVGAAVVVALLVSSSALAQTGKPAEESFQPALGQAGKDVVWVPTAQALVDKMLDMAKVTPLDVVIDLGSGDGITVISAAKRGAQALGIEYNPEMVALSRKNATAAGVADKATFIKADLFESDFSKATVITMFLLPSINMKLRPTILGLKPGTRVVSNTFDMEDWAPDDTAQVTGECSSWCNALLWIVPAKVEGTWKTPQGELVLHQHFQTLTGTLGGRPIGPGTVRGEQVMFTVGTTTYIGRFDGTSITGMAGSDSWTATR